MLLSCHHVGLTSKYQSRIKGAKEEYKQRPWRSVEKHYTSILIHFIMVHKHNKRGVPQNVSQSLDHKLARQGIQTKTKLEDLNHSKTWNQASNMLWGYDQEFKMLILKHVAQVHLIYLKDSKGKKKGTSNSYMNEIGSSIKGQVISSINETILDVSFLNMLSLVIWWPQTQAKSLKFKAKTRKEH